MQMRAIFSAVVILFTVHAQAARLHPQFEAPLENEAELQENIRRGILFIQKQVATSSGTVRRGTHAKGVCAKADFEILPVALIAQGIFNHPGTYPALVRFANAASTIEHDQTPDVRSLSVAVTLPPEISNPQGRIDFSTNNATTFPINDAQVFSDLMILAEKGLFWGGIEVGVGGLWSANRARELGELQKAPAITPYQKIRYFSGVPFLYGQGQAIKYAFTPCATNVGQPLDNDYNTLTNELIRHLESDPVMSCFDFQIQMLNPTRMTDGDGIQHPAHEWVENATEEWPESQAPFVTVGRLTLQRNSHLTFADCEDLRFNVNKNTTPDHRGLGSINRARTAAEEASASGR